MIILDKNLATRESARKLFKKLLNNKDYFLDFKNVELVSRSFTNELILLEKNNKITISKNNLNSKTKFMFDIADKVLDSDILSKNNYSTISLKQYASLI